jgi:hypothetical protein
LIACLKLLPLLSGGESIFKVRRLRNRVVALHGDTARSRGVCSLLLEYSRKTRTWIYGCLIDSVVLYALTNPYLSSLEGHPSFKKSGG